MVANRTPSFKTAKNDEFYTQWADVEREVNAYLEYEPDNNKARIYKQNEVDADHVTVWSKGGSMSLSNLIMLYVPHKRAEGNR